MLAWSGLAVRARTSSTSAATSAGFVQLRAIVPSAPAFDTAAASAGTDAPPIGACTIGTSIPRRSQTGVRTGFRLVRPGHVRGLTPAMARTDRDRTGPQWPWPLRLLLQNDRFCCPEQT